MFSMMAPPWLWYLPGVGTSPALVFFWCWYLSGSGFSLALVSLPGAGKSLVLGFSPGNVLHRRD